MICGRCSNIPTLSSQGSSSRVNLGTADDSGNVKGVWHVEEISGDWGGALITPIYGFWRLISLGFLDVACEYKE